MNDASVEMLTDSEPSPPVPQVSSTSPSNGTRTMRVRMARAAPTISSTVSPFMRSATKRPPICAGVATPSMIKPTTSVISSAVRCLPSDTLDSACFMSNPDAGAGGATVMLASST